MKNILFASSECVPLLRPEALQMLWDRSPKDFDKEKYDVRVVIPNICA